MGVATSERRTTGSASVTSQEERDPLGLEKAGSENILGDSLRESEHLGGNASRNRFWEHSRLRPELRWRSCCNNSTRKCSATTREVKCSLPLLIAASRRVRITTSAKERRQRFRMNAIVQLGGADPLSSRADPFRTVRISQHRD